MVATPVGIREFLSSRRIAVTGVSREGRLPANAIYRRLRACGYEVFPVNPAASEVEGARCFADLRSVPGELDAVMVASPPGSAPEIARQAIERGVRRVWFHRSFGDGSVSADAVAALRAAGVEPVVGGCPLMFCGKVDVFHRCMAWWLQRSGKLPR